MLNRGKHQLIMGQILKDIYSDISVGPLLGFKGGTCAYFFYNLPRFSVDLDFDLLVTNEKNQKLVFEKIVAILSKYGQIKDQYIKRFTIFVLLSYGNDDHNIKVEINVRKLVENIKDHYEMKEYLGISMFVAKKDYLFASKLCALTMRTETAMRDIYDIHYFAKSNWDINAEVIKERTDKTIKEYLADCIAFIEKVKDNQMLQGLGELVDSEKEKAWIRTYLKTDSIFMLKNYMSVLK
ncbi:MAG: nucleotidyl transferase AbiEii/AbiGii toxin family protein [Candidatus Pacebacteria bacterium]|jgi:predicted nucleotidyltransferase component of viral defense system|nr:nucleotidyl transferase AbiEii/AbiGii toxin family protein [Candidatus Paceibacterota bacterium]